MQRILQATTVWLENRLLQVSDVVAPVITKCITSVTVDPNNFGCTSLLLDYRSAVVASDNCSSAGTLTQSPAAGTALPAVINTIAIKAIDASGNYSICNFTVTVTSPLVATSTTDNSQLFFGLSTDQLARITTTPTGGTCPYTIEYTMSRPLNCNINGGSETWTGAKGIYSNIANVCPSTTPLSVSTSTVVSSYTIIIKLMADATITAKVKDKFGCVVQSTVRIWAKDVRCFAGKSGNTKVKICHKTGSTCNPCQEICVDESAVQSHLNHGDFVGTCTSDCKLNQLSRRVVIGKEKLIEIESFNVIAYPNPSNHLFTLAVQGGSEEKVEVLVYDMLARMVKRIEKINEQNIRFGEEFPSGEYLIFVRQGVNQKVINVIKQ